ncbi:ATPase [Alginatibacterium sediminis]|uniref:ATPase n=1 Tax=Alginatibacterium sediminis TaxID=2164068 RepID=A0A420ED14_9ALTE|nr:ATPase [Alginatibacterium sediminis]RKF18561.1 ATPase [Alginatibacterium sediminis]
MLEDLINGIEGSSEPELKVPSMDEQKRIVAKLKTLEDAGELSPELLEAYLTGKKTVD